MGMPEEGETSAIRQRFRELCLDLNMDSETEEDAWEAFERISHHYTLEGEPQHWLACSLYVSCRKTTVPTVSGQDDVEGNCVSLTRLLRTTKLSLIDFFKKMKKWADMASLPQLFRDKVDRLERNFAVSTVIFSKFEPIFTDIFITPSLPLSPNYSAAAADNPPKAAKGRKQKRTSITVNEVFCFCWTTFVQVKGNYPLISDNLVNSYHLLLCCIDWIFANILIGNRRELLNSEFAGLPSNFRSRDYRPPSEPPCIINILCDKHEGLPKEAKCIKEHYWKPYIKKHFEKKHLVGNMDTLSKVLDVDHFDKNCKSLNNMYEEYVLNIGDFDERIFLGEDSVTELGTPAASMSHQNIDNLTEKIRSKKALFEDMMEPCPLRQATPLTNRRYLVAKEGIFSPVSTATQSVSRLHKMLSGRKAGPSEELIKMFSNCPKNPSTSVQKRISEMGKAFCEKYSQSSEIPEENGEGNSNFAKRILQLAESLYYLTLENIIVSELRNPVIPVDSRISVAATIFQQDELHRSLFAITLEVVNFSYNSQKVFPWIVEVLEIPVFCFYKVIEIVNRVEKGLSRDVVKHLNHVEEMILDNLVWRSDSALWEVLKKYGNVPTVEEVLLPSQFSHDSSSHSNNNNNNSFGIPTNGLPMTAIMPNSSISGGINNGHNTIMIYNAVGGASPMTRPIHETFTSPVPVRRRLFEVGPVHTPHPNNQENIISIRTKTIVAKHITVQLSPTKRKNEDRLENLPGAPPAKMANKPKKTGSVPIFFRKVYYLASVRLRDLCDRLSIDQLLCTQIWTCIEHVFIKHIELLKDRHLDQIIMCCIYAICRVTGKEKTFHDIMRCYRQQPQANSYVYRSVLLESHANEPTNQAATARASQSHAATSARDERRLRREREAEANVRSNSLPQTSSPTRAAGTSLSFPSEDRGDLVKFYNAIFLKVIKSFAFKFHPEGDGDKDNAPVILSPLPAIRGQPLSPRRVTPNVYVSPINSPRGGAIAKGINSTTPLSSNSSRLLYCFNKSPSRDLQAINSMIRSSCTANGIPATDANGTNNSARLNIAGDQQSADQSGDTRAFRKRLHQVVTERHAANGNA